MDEHSPIDVPLAAPSVRPPEQLRFTGTGSEYFGIWIVNLLLSIVTLGIYTAWAKVRRMQYFYRHTELAGSSFDFHGQPGRILVGRILAVALFAVYNYGVRLQSVWTLVVIGALALIVPWLLRNSFRFRLYNTSWRGTRFHFRGSTLGAYRVFLLNGFLTLITLSTLSPYMKQQLKAYQHGNSWFGQTRFTFHARASQFYKIYLPFWGGLACALILAIGLGVLDTLLRLIETLQHHAGNVDTRALIAFVAIFYGAVILISVSIVPAIHALVSNLIWNNTRLGEHRIECHMSAWKLIWIVASNLMMVMVTLGLFIPWATVRMTRYHVESMRLIPASDLQEFVAAEPESVSAIGEEAAAVFDFDIAL